MGFWSNLADEAGKKTGKAIGNSIFGDAAADQTINIKGGVNGGGEGGEAPTRSRGMLSQRMDAETQMEMATRKNNMNRENELLKLEFDDSDVQNNYKILFKLMSMTDAWVKNSWDENSETHNLYELARSKYDAGVLMCQMMDPTNPNIVLFLNKQKEWDETIKKGKKSRTLKIVYMVVGWLLLILFLTILINFA